MSKKEEKAKVGRPKLADKDLIKDSWCRIAASLSIVIVMIISKVVIINKSKVKACLKLGFRFVR